MTLAMTRPSDDRRLVREAQGGSADAFRTIVDLYHERLFSVILRIVQDHADAEEVTQETFLRAYRNLSRFQLDSALYTWLYRIAVNAAVDLAKKRRRRAALSLDEEHAGFDQSLPASGQQPFERSERAELLALVREGIEALPERYRLILTLREFSELTYEELMETLDLPKGTVESRLFRARSRLRDWLLRRLGDDALELLEGLVG